MIMFDGLDLGKLVAYERKQDQHFKKYCDQIWALQCQTEVRACSEHFVRVERQAVADCNTAWRMP